MPVATIHKMGQGDLYMIHFLERTDPGFGGGHPGGVDPGYGHPIGGHPGHALPGGGHIDNSLPGGAGHPDNRPPGHPPVVAAGQTLVLVRDPVGVWHYATIDASTPPPKPVPVPPPDYATGQPVPPTATPTAAPTRRLIWKYGDWVHLGLCAHPNEPRSQCLSITSAGTSEGFPA